MHVKNYNCIVKRKRPDLKDLENLVTPDYACCWKEIGAELKIPTGILNSIEIGFQTNPTWCCNKMWLYWDEVDPKASWDDIIKAIDSPAISAMIKRFKSDSFPVPVTSVINKTLESVANLSCRLKIMSINKRYKAEDDNWPLISPKHFTSVALMHHKDRQTEREVLAVAALQKEGDIDLQKINTNDNSKVKYMEQSNCTKDISNIFGKVDGSNKPPDIILIEGVPGIGKTIISKEIMFQWAKGELLPDITLMFLIYLRDTESHNITSLESFVNYVSYPQVAKDTLKYIIDNEGKSLMIIFDGYDELPENLRSDSFLYKLMSRSLTQIPFYNVVITSRPNVSAHLHDKVDLRVEILGFTNEDRKAYIVDALKHNDDKIKKLMAYLNSHPAIDAYCYIPLNMTILLNFFENNDGTDVAELPNTQTGINEKFICTTISRYIRRTKGLEINFSKFSEVRAPCNEHKIGSSCSCPEEGVPYCKILKEISELAFKELEQNKIVFTTSQLKVNCPCLESHSENWNGLGLLKAVQLFTMENNLRNVSFNFLHFTIQEMLAAYHITLMSEANQLNCMKETFWNNKYYNTWIMYVGLAKNQLPITFKHFLSGHWFFWETRLLNWWSSGTYCQIQKPFINDKIKSLYLFQCFSEAENDYLCQYVGQLLKENEIDLSGQTLSAVNILTISLFLTRCTTKHWNTLNLSKCYIGDNGIKQLHNSFTSNNRSKVCIDTLNLSHNNLTQSSVVIIASLILEWNIKNITLNDIDQHNLNEGIIDKVMQYPTNQISFIAYNCNKNETIFARLSQYDYVMLSSTSDKVAHRITSVFTAMQAKSDFRIKIIIHELIKNSVAIKYFNLGANISKFQIPNIAELIKTNALMEYLYLPKMQFFNQIFFHALKSNKSLKYVDMSLMTVDGELVNDIIDVIESNSNLKEIKISKLVLRDDNFYHIKDYLVKISGLKSISITGYSFTELEINGLANAIKNNHEIWQMILANCQFTSISQLRSIFAFKSVIGNLKWLDLSSCQLNIKMILCDLKEMKCLQHIDLSENMMDGDAVDGIVAMIKVNQNIQSLSLPNCELDQKDIKIIIQAMQTISSLQYVDFTNNILDNELASDVALVITKNSELEELKFSKLKLSQSGFQHLKTHLVKVKGLTTYNITSCSFTEHNAAALVTGISDNSEIQEINLSSCTIPIDQLLSSLSSATKLKRLHLSNCFVKPNEVKKVFGVLKLMKCLQCVDLSKNKMESDAVMEIAAMIKNNEHIQSLSLPNCVLDQKDLRIIIQAMQTVSLLQYVDFNNNILDNELAGDVALLITKNSELMDLKFSKLKLYQTGFQDLNDNLVRIKGLTSIYFINCSFTKENAVTLVSVIINNSEIRALNLMNSVVPRGYSQVMISYATKLQWLNLSNCSFQSIEITNILNVLKQMKHLQHVDLSGNKMESDAVDGIVAMIKNNKHIKKLFLPNGTLNQEECRSIIQVMETASSLQYVDLSTNQIDNELASDISTLFANNSKLEELNFCKLTLKQSGFQHLLMHFVKLRGIKHLSIIDCSFTNKDVVYVIKNNLKIKSLTISNCKLMTGQKVIMTDCIGRYDQLESLEVSNVGNFSPYINQILVSLCYSKLKQIILSDCQLQANEIKQILTVLKYMRNLECVDLSGNAMADDSVCDMETMIVNNKHLQKLCLPNCTLDESNLRVITQSLQTLSSLQYVDFNANNIDEYFF